MSFLIRFCHFFKGPIAFPFLTLKGLIVMIPSVPLALASQSTIVQ